MESKIVYIAYPVTKKDRHLAIYEIVYTCANVHTESIIPFVPYFHLLFCDFAGSDGVGFRKKTIESYFVHTCVCEVWLYGDMFSWDTLKAVRLAHRYGIPVIPKTDTMKRFFNVLP